MKKLGLLFIPIITILWIGTSFADVIEPNTHYVNRCVKFQNVEIDNYRVVVENNTVMDRDVYEPQAEQCLKGHYKFGESRQYLLDKSVNIDEINRFNAEDKAIQIWELNVNGYYVDDINPLERETITYKIVNDGDKYKLEVVESEQGISIPENRIGKFFIARILTVLIETVVLFVIAKLFRKKVQISNWRLILIGILASTITLPLLRFVFPLFIVDGVEYVVIGELSVILIEIFIIKYGLKVSRGKAILASVACNLCSYLFGLLVL